MPSWVKRIKKLFEHPDKANEKNRRRKLRAKQKKLALASVSASAVATGAAASKVDESASLNVLSSTKKKQQNIIKNDNDETILMEEEDIVLTLSDCCSLSNEQHQQQQQQQQQQPNERRVIVPESSDMIDAPSIASSSSSLRSHGTISTITSNNNNNNTGGSRCPNNDRSYNNNNISKKNNNNKQQRKKKKRRRSKPVVKFHPQKTIQLTSDTISYEESKLIWYNPSELDEILEEAKFVNTLYNNTASSDESQLNNDNNNNNIIIDQDKYPKRGLELVNDSQQNFNTQRLHKIKQSMSAVFDEQHDCNIGGGSSLSNDDGSSLLLLMRSNATSNSIFFSKLQLRIASKYTKYTMEASMKAHLQGISDMMDAEQLNEKELLEEIQSTSNSNKQHHQQQQQYGMMIWTGIRYVLLPIFIALLITIVVDMEHINCIENLRGKITLGEVVNDDSFSFIDDLNQYARSYLRPAAVDSAVKQVSLSLSSSLSSISTNVKGYITVNNMMGHNHNNDYYYYYFNDKNNLGGGTTTKVVSIASHHLRYSFNTLFYYVQILIGAIINSAVHAAISLATSSLSLSSSSTLLNTVNGP